MVGYNFLGQIADTETVLYIVEGSYIDNALKECYGVNSVIEISKELFNVEYYTPE